MKAKAKAIELVNRFLQVYDGRVPQAKQCALICVDEMLEELGEELKLAYKYWKEVKQEINKL